MTKTDNTSSLKSKRENVFQHDMTITTQEQNNYNSRIIKND